MKRSEMNQLMETGAHRRMALCRSKGADYSNDGDALLNFKQLNRMCDMLNVDPSRGQEETALYFMLHKIQRLCNIRDKAPCCESVLDTIDDLHNYTDLYHALLIDNAEAETAEVVAGSVVLTYAKENEDHE